MRSDKERATELRFRGISYKAISRELGVPTSTLSGWFKNQPWSIEIRNRLADKNSHTGALKLQKLAEATRRRWRALREQYQKEAVKEFSQLRNNPLFTAGILLYWGEGDRVLKNSRVRLGNSDPAMIKLFYQFLREALNIPEEKIKAWLLLYPDLIDAVQKKFWNVSTAIPLSQFNKSIYIRGRRANRRLSYGVCYLSVSSREIKEKILKWIELIQNDLLRARQYL